MRSMYQPRNVSTTATRVSLMAPKTLRVITKAPDRHRPGDRPDTKRIHLRILFDLMAGVGGLSSVGRHFVATFAGKKDNVAKIGSG